MRDFSGGDIQEEIARARALHAHYGAGLMADPDVFDLLEKYRAAIENTGRAMRQMGIGQACASCAAEEHGSCCFPGMEDGYDHVLLLINLLYGHSLPDAAEIPGSCIFVGERGCKLIARCYFCVHFLCPGLHEVLEPAAVRSLLRLVGEELHAGWELERLLRSWLRNHGPVSTQ